MTKIKAFFFKQDGDKESVDGSKITLAAVPLLVMMGLAYLRGQRPADIGTVEIGTGRAVHTQQVVPPKTSGERLAGLSVAVGEKTQTSPIPPKVAVQSRKTSRERRIKYGARQVISRNGTGDGFLPVGTKMAGTLTTAIDTRFKGQLIQVVLPEGAIFRGERRLAKGTSLFGPFRYSGKGNRVFIRLTRGVTPMGREFSVSAQVLSPGNLSPGLSGVFHGNADGRTASTLALAAGTGAAEALTRKEVLGGHGVSTVKSTLKNALIHGAAKAGTVELERNMKEVAESPEYVTVAAGSALIVILTESLKGGNHGKIRQ